MESRNEKQAEMMYSPLAGKPESVVSTEEGREDEDKPGSTCTTASLGSLASRIRGLAVDFGPKTHDRVPELFDDIYEDGASEEEEVVSITEDQLLAELEKTEPAFQVCQRLFKPLEGPACEALRLKRLTLEQARSLQQNGFLVVDNFLAPDVAARLRCDTVAFHRQGRLQEACNIGNNPSNDRSARGDWIMWLHQGTPPAISPSYSALLAAFQELQEDLAQIMHLRLQSCEHQLSFYPPNGSQYVRHRDAFPDDGSESDQRRVTAITYANPNWRPQDGGKLRLWIPAAGERRSTDGPPQQASPPSSQHCGATSAASESDARQDSLESLPPHPSGNGLPNGNGIPNGHASGYSGHHDALPNGGLPNGGLPNGYSGTDMQNGIGMHEQPLSSRELQYIANRSGSLASSVVVEPTEASSIQDNASLDGNSVRSADRSKHTEEVGSAAVLDVAPLAGRLVLFLSGAVEHAVLPNFSERIAVTCWCQ